MRRKNWMRGLLVAMLVALLLPATAYAAEGKEDNSIDFATFLEAVEGANYDYDGQGVTVKWSPSSACTDNRQGHECLLGEGSHAPDGNNPQRGQAPNAQYQIFSGQENVSIKNVNFVFEPADFTICMNSGWKGAFSADSIKNAELQLQNTGSVAFTGCTFDSVIVSPYGSRANARFEGCGFNDVYNAYAIKDVYSPGAVITGCTFTNCGGGIYFEGTDAKTSITITDNVFKDVDRYAADGKAMTRGLIQFSANGDYSAASIAIAGNTSTGGAAAIRQLNTSITESVLHLDEMMGANQFDGTELTESSFSNNTVYYNGSYYPTLAAALEAVYMDAPVLDAKVYCKPSADVGAMTHGHVADNLVIYGNNARVTGGERDLEIDTYKYDRATGKQSNEGVFLDKDITVKVIALDGIAAWGQRNTPHTINLVFEDCQNMERIYFTNAANSEGVININAKGCSFDATTAPVSSKNTSVYSNSNGVISIKDTVFKGIAVGLNINHKSAGEQAITLDGCKFIDCALSGDAGVASTKTYGAPVRVVSKDGAITRLSVKNTAFEYGEGKTNWGNGDILIGDGRFDAAEKQGIVTLEMASTAANVMVQQKGYYVDEAGSTTNASKGAMTAVGASDTVRPDENNHFIVDKYVPPTPPSGGGSTSDKTEVEHNQDGSTTTTVTKPDGSQTITHETATGTESVVKKDEDGNVTSTEVTVSKTDAESGKVELPLADAEPATDVDKAPEVEVKVPSSVTAEKPVQVTVPVAKGDGSEPNYGVVVFAVDEDGNETLIPKTAVDDDGNVIFEVSGDVTIKVVDNAKDMPDVKETDWFAGDVVDFATARGIVNGVALPDGSRVFDGYGRTSRGMFVAMLHNLELNPEAASEGSLADVPSDAFYADAAAWALEEGILSGVDMPDGSKQFQGGADVTREQVAVFLMRYAQHLGMDVSARAEIDFPDAGEVSGFAKEAMSWAVAEGLFTGDDVTGELNPTDGAARAEVAAVLMRFINLMYA